MSNTNTGGPAFPTNDTHTPENGWSRAKDGMTLRDYFAAKAMQGIVAGADPEHGINLLGVAEWSYNMAEAMLKARNQ